MKKLLLFALLLFVLAACRQTILNEELSNTKIVVKVEAVHSTGEIVTSDIISIR